MSKKKTIDFDGSCYDYYMRNNNVACGFNMPDALKGDSTHSLPPYAKRRSFLVDEYPACPSNWMRSEGRLKSFFVPVKENKGMWLDFNECQNHTHHVAIVISVQGINPITGLPCNDPQMEQYIDKCPKHKIAFGPDKYCKECDFKWPKQNYICTTGTPNGRLWIDGFKAADGIVRQYILTAEKMRGVASNIIGKDRVYAIGLSFFLSKDKKPKSTSDNYLRGNNWTNGTPNGIVDDSYYKTIIGGHSPWYTYNTATLDSFDMTKNSEDHTQYKSLNALEIPKATYCYASSMDSARCLGSVKEVKTKNLEVGAGAKITQSVYDDPERLDFWHDDPESIICVNYCSEKEAREIIKEGKIDINGNSEGFLKDIPVGN